MAGERRRWIDGPPGDGGTKSSQEDGENDGL